MASAAALLPNVERQRARFRFVLPLIALLALVGFVTVRGNGVATAADTQAQAEQYVRLALALDRLHDGEVDGWFGPALPDQPDPAIPHDPDGLDRAVTRLAASLATPGKGADEERRVHLRILVRRLTGVMTIIGNSPSDDFYREAAHIYGLAEPTDAEAAHWKEARTQLDALLPGEGPLVARLEKFRSRFIVPLDSREALFTQALAECRARTLAQWKLPAEERLDLVWTAAVPAAWHRYEGNLRSVLRINRQALALPGQAMDLACHEAYPGHHAQFVLADAAAGPGGLPVEDRLTLLRSPESVIREGAADFGVELVFPSGERIAFLRDTLFPLAGLDPADAPLYARIEALERTASGMSLPILARYRDGTLSRAAAAAALADEALVASPAALLDFTDRYGAYVTGYTLARDRVRSGLTRNCGGSPWEPLRALVEQPRAPPPYVLAAGFAVPSS
ncbi:hypothetical protein [Sphingobium cloacae]|uniref:DUF885 domain-containing protein n=1 Tax=Sphingobium cloacae TaxID=120107 RepID=A0A1E1F4Z7_9SPHN|nr:hypothetical protein [Sphingobium cloacae]BAV65586.1 hypothetical protein SCLO_1025460 [Sphingobium cloacae]